MNRNQILGGILVAAVLALVLGWAVYVGWGPAPGGGSSETIEEFPTASPPALGGDDGGGGGTGPPSPTETPPFTFTIDAVEECGTTCRDVTTSLHNRQDESASGVTVYTRIFAGADTTDEDDLVWEGTESAGTLEAGASHTTTKRVELSIQEGRRIEQEDGWITVLTSVETDDQTITFQENERVA